MRHLGTRIAVATLSGLLAAGCTVQPLNAPSAPANVAASPALASIYIAAVDDRVGQQLRNHLIFLLNGGSGQPANPQYELELTVATADRSALIIQSDVDNEPSASKVTVTANYTLARAADGTVVSKRRAYATASYDVSSQEFANIRASRDAENRAARDVAERLRALIAADLKRAGAL